MEWEVLFFLFLLFPLFFFGNIYKIAIDFNFLEKKDSFFFFFFFFFFSVMTRFCFIAPYYKGIKQIPPCGLKWIFKLN